MPARQLSATLERDEAVLRFPFDETLRQLLRAIPGRRWDPGERCWRIPLGAEQAHSLALLLSSLAFAPDVDAGLTQAISRRRARRRRDVAVVELARPDDAWWLSFALDGPQATVQRLLAHPGARVLEPLGRAVLPLDEPARLLARQLAAGGELLLDEATQQAVAGRAAAAAQPATAVPAADVEFRRDRRGAHWVLVAARGAALARTLAARAGLSPVEGPQGSVGLAADERDAPALLAIVEALEELVVEPRVRSWLRRATSWRGHVEVQGPHERPLLTLVGDHPHRLPQAVRERAHEIEGGVALALTLEAWRLVAPLDGWVSPAARRCLRALEQGRPAPAAVLELSHVHDEPTFVLAAGHEPGLLEVFARIQGASTPQLGRSAAHEHASLPSLRADPFCVPELDAFLADEQVWVAEDALTQLQSIRQEHALAAGLVELSAAHDATLDVPGLGGQLKPFQRAGVAYLLARRRAFLADEQGLGKTIEALATLQAADAFPAVVVCPANLKLNWLREVQAWLPGRTVSVLRGQRESSAGAAGQADVSVLNYEILDARLQELLARRPRALVIDEAHYCKNGAAKRTRAVQRLAAELPTDAIVLALSGTPVVNRPAELVAQLRIIGRLSEFGSGARFAARFRGADAHQRLHWHLRARCFVRRLKRDVLPQLPAKTRAVVPIELDNEGEYRVAEADLLAWLRTQPLDLRELDAKVAAAVRAERLVRLSALKLLAARGKLAAALAWIHDFASSGERLVVFAHHREVQQALLERFPGALHILGQDSALARERALRAFQEPDDGANQLIVCSMEVAGQGITLTRSSNVAFLELDWTPAKHDQAEDRCHRIGQQDAVNAYYLLAADTIDETIASLLERKRAVIGAVTDGSEEDQEGIVDALVRELRSTPYRHLRAVA